MWKHLSKQISGNFKASSDMEGKKGQVVYQRKYRKKISAINKINAAFMEYAQEKAPELVASFFKTQEVTISETYYPFC